MSFIKDYRKKKHVQEQFSSTDVSKLNMYNVMRMQNCKTYTFQKGESYPNIRPPISQCSSSRTIELFSKAMIDNGCGSFDPTIASKCGTNFSKSKAHAVSPTNAGRQLFHLYAMEHEEHKARQTPPEKVKEWCQLTPYELMRLQNCKSFQVAKEESYPNIKPPASHCDPAKTVEWLVDSINSGGCGRHGDMEQDDVLDIWKQTPNKQVLSYYGVRSGTVHGPEAVRFNQTITKLLEKTVSSRPTVEVKDAKPEPKLSPYYTGICGPFLLNRQQLWRKVKSMPTVLEKTDPHQAFTVLHCPEPVEKEQTAPIMPPYTAFGIDKPASRPKHGVRRKHKYCELQCGIPQNQCTDYEWRKYQLDPAKYSEELELDLKQMEPANPEPRNYDELYSNLVSCFETCDKRDFLCDLYDKYCRPPKPLDQFLAGTPPPPGMEKPVVIKKVEEIIEEMENEPQPDLANKEEEEKKSELDVKEPPIDEIDKSKKEKHEREKQENEHREPTSPKSSKQKKGKEKPGKENLENEGSEKKHPKSKMSEKEQPGKKKSGKENSGKEKSGKEKSEFVKSEFEKSEFEKSEFEKSEFEKPEFEKPEFEKFQEETPGKERPGKERPRKEKTEKEKSENEKSEKSSYDTTDSKSKDNPSDIDDIFQMTSKESKDTQAPGRPEGFSKFPKPSKKKVPPAFKPAKKPEKPEENGCPCYVCELLKRRKAEIDTPLISQLMREDKQRQMRDNLKQMYHRQYTKSRGAEYRAPQHKCDPIVCDDFFCRNPKLGEYCECLQAMEELQKLLGPKHCIEKNELIFNLEDLKSRICRRFCDCF